MVVRFNARLRLLAWFSNAIRLAWDEILAHQLNGEYRLQFRSTLPRIK